MELSEKDRDKCHTIIHAASISAAGIAAATAQMPMVDAVPLTALEVGMVISLGAVFGISLTESGAKSIVAGTLGTLVGRGVSQFLVGWIPVVGNAINAATAAGVVEALGWAVVADFSNRDNRLPGA